MEERGYNTKQAKIRNQIIVFCGQRFGFILLPGQKRHNIWQQILDNVRWPQAQNFNWIIWNKRQRAGGTGCPMQSIYFLPLSHNEAHQANDFSSGRP